MCRQLTRNPSSLTNELNIPHDRVIKKCPPLQVFRKCSTLCLRPLRLVHWVPFSRGGGKRVSETCWPDTSALRQSDRITLVLRNWTDNTWLSSTYSVPTDNCTSICDDLCCSTDLLCYMTGWIYLCISVHWVLYFLEHSLLGTDEARIWIEWDWKI